MSRLRHSHNSVAYDHAGREVWACPGCEGEASPLGWSYGVHDVGGIRAVTITDKMSVLMDHRAAEDRPSFLFGSLVPPHSAVDADYARRALSISEEPICGEVLELLGRGSTLSWYLPELLSSLHGEIEGAGVGARREDEGREYGNYVTHTHMMTPVEILA